MAPRKSATTDFANAELNNEKPQRFDIQAALEAVKTSLPPLGKNQATVTDARASEKTDATWLSLEFTIDLSDGDTASVTDVLCVEAAPDSPHATRFARGLRRAGRLAELNGANPADWEDVDDLAADLIGAKCTVTIAHGEDADGIPTASIRAIQKPKG